MVSASIDHRAHLTTDIYDPKTMTLTKYTSTGGAANRGQAVFKYPLLNTFPADDNDGMALDPKLSGARLQDFHVWKFFVAAKGDFRLLPQIHNEAFSKEGIKLSRPQANRGLSTNSKAKKESRTISLLTALSTHIG
ncbi:MAG: hypothetical protein Q9196_007491 [Gyalolechia fulgens]